MAAPMASLMTAEKMGEKMRAAKMASMMKAERKGGRRVQRKAVHLAIPTAGQSAHLSVCVLERIFLRTTMPVHT